MLGNELPSSFQYCFLLLKKYCQKVAILFYFLVICQTFLDIRY